MNKIKHELVITIIVISCLWHEKALHGVKWSKKMKYENRSHKIQTGASIKAYKGSNFQN
jgi:hypothetical protein